MCKISYWDRIGGKKDGWIYTDQTSVGSQNVGSKKKGVSVKKVVAQWSA